ncbi:MAG: SDR family NAD(P)-dependent oxidoreductase [Steroidobacteraceae bacterium]
MNRAVEDVAPLVLKRPDRRVALITGAGSGIGASIALAYARLGVRVLVSDIDYALAGTVAAQIRGAGGQAVAHRCDVAAEDQVATVVQRAVREFGALHFVVNNAGPNLKEDPLGHWARLLNANLLGTLLITRHAIEAMRERGGSIVNIAADSGLGFGAEEQPAYAAAKAGVMRFTAALRFLQEQSGIRVNCIVPDGQIQDQEFADSVVELSRRESFAGRVVLCRSGRPLELVPYGDPGYQVLEPF